MSNRWLVLAILLFSLHSAFRLFADENLFKVCFGSEQAVKGELYSHNPRGGAVVAFQVLKNGVLAKMHKMYSTSLFAEEKIIFVAMDTNGVSDGNVLPSGLYRCTGTTSYETAMGATKTVPAFEKLRDEEESKIYHERREAEKRLEQELREIAIKEQPERKKIAETIIGNVDLNMGCIRIEKSIAPSFEIKVKNFMWKKLVESKTKQDYLTFLNVADDIVNNRLDYTNRFDLIPSEKTIQSVCDALKKYRFKCDFSCEKELAFLETNADWVDFISSRMLGIDMSLRFGRISRVSYQVPNGSFNEFKPSGVLSYIQEEYGLAILGEQQIIIGAKGSVENLCRGDLEEKAESLCKKINNREISRTEFDAEMREIDNEVRRTINEGLIPLPHGAELERIRKEDKDRRTANLIRARQEFIDAVSKLSFCLGDYVIVQKALVEYVHSVKSDELWCRLRELQSVADWDGMVRMLVPAQLDDGGRRYWDDDELKWPRAKMSEDADLRSKKSKVDLCDPKVWELARRNLYAQKFKFQVFFTRNRTYYQRRGTKWVDHSFCNNDYLDIELKVAEKDLLYIYAQDDFHAYIDPLEKKINEPGFDVTGWLNSHPIKMFDAFTKLSARERTWPGPRDVSPLLKHKDDELNTAKEDLSRFRRAVAAVKWPPEYLVVTNVSVVGGKMVYTEKKKPFKIPQKVRGLARLFDNGDVVELYGKYCGDLNLDRFKEEWKNAGKKQENVYEKYKTAFEKIEKAILKSIEKAGPNGSSNKYDQPLSLEAIAKQQSNYREHVERQQPKPATSKTVKPVCENCRGRRYVQVSETCSRCGGKGETYTPARKMIVGYSRPRTSPCPVCSGKGFVRKSRPCPDCSK